MKAVTGGVLRHVSASQIQTFERCERKWWYDKVAGMRPEETSPALELGTDLHGQIEEFLTGGPKPVHPSALKLVEHPDFPVPVPDPEDVDLMVEFPRDYNLGLKLAGVPVRGRMDLLDRRLLDPTIWDWKTTKDWRYAKTTDELNHNLQLLIYGAWALQTWPGTEQIRFAHGYMLTSGKGGAARVVFSDFLRPEQVSDRVIALEPLIERMKLAANVSEAKDVAANPAACSDFGGCPFRNVCNRGAKNANERLKLLFRTTEETPAVTVNLKEKLDADRPAPPTGLHLYINVVPVKGATAGTYLDDVVAEHSKLICAREGVGDLRLVPFGKGKGFLAESIRENPPDGVVYARSGELNDAAIEALIPLAASVHQAVSR